ncbi:hypothetical protein [Halomonas korlensis]|uniref:Uncharacterized protein n=1 Tax=Halomonas korlensis TaxID=463301 RepID=A0A1I7KLW6_9GAMM|nr:hypothetical protein [Halomonas korlensis]SFU98433.1 hypothetical protein SAMN04487955_1266 [Halomonas korlensis]
MGQAQALRHHRMATAPIFFNYGNIDVEDKHRPLSLVVLDLHCLGIFELEGVPTPRYIPMPQAEPGDCFEILLVNNYPMLAPLDEARPSLLPGPSVMIHDSAGDQGEIAAASLLD